jgi:flagellar basal body-associated protein FliL
MLEDGNREGAPTLPLVKTLVVVAALLVLVILAGTVLAVATGSRQRALARDSVTVVEGSDIFDLGQVRTKSADPKPAVIAAKISFPYPAASVDFREELQRKAPALRAAAITFLTAKKSEELHPAYQGAVKAGLRDAFNALLSLGAVDEVWLTDFAVLR